MAPLTTLYANAVYHTTLAASGVTPAGSRNEAAIKTRCDMANAFKPAVDNVVGNLKGLALFIAGPVGIIILIAILVLAWRTSHVAGLLITLVVVFIAATLLATNFNIMPGACS